MIYLCLDDGMLIACMCHWLLHNPKKGLQTSNKRDALANSEWWWKVLSCYG